MVSAKKLAISICFSVSATIACTSFAVQCSRISSPKTSPRVRSSAPFTPNQRLMRAKGETSAFSFATRAPSINVAASNPRGLHDAAYAKLAVMKSTPSLSGGAGNADTISETVINVARVGGRHLLFLRFRHLCFLSVVRGARWNRTTCTRSPHIPECPSLRAWAFLVISLLRIQDSMLLHFLRL